MLFFYVEEIMKRYLKQGIGVIHLLLLAATVLFHPSELLASGYCSSGVVSPPFLSTGVDPNLLLIFDNSASMLDLAYEGAEDTCYDDTYDGANAYTGYFEDDTWYAYNFTDGRFEEITLLTAVAEYISAEFKRPGELYIDGPVSSGELTGVTAFGALGRVLNWAAASKIDIQKKILTGGKYDDSDEEITMESRGCGDRRYVKKLEVTGSLGTAFLTFGIRPPRAETHDAWENGVAYVVGDVVNDAGDLLKATTNGTSSGTSTSDDAGVTWVSYTDTLWTNGVTYPAGAVVSDPAKANTIDAGQLYFTATGGTTNGSGIDDDTGITDWLPYDTTHIEIFRVTPTGFNNDSCQLAIEELAKDSPNQGQLKQYIDDCMGYVSGGGSSDAANSHAAFNHAIHNCWYNAKHGVWPPGAGAVNSQKNACEDIYTSGVHPWNISPDDRGYGCYGLWSGDPDNETGYVGRCWKPGAGAVLTCTGGYFTSGSKAGQCKKWEWVGGAAATWDASGYADVDTCIETAMRDYCGTFSIPEVIDPSDQVGTDTGDSEEFWNIPAVLVDSGVIAQLDQPIAVMLGIIYSPLPAPEGLIQEFSNDIRIGAMVFNAEGSDYECTQTDPFVLYNCDDPGNMDGGRIVAEIAQSGAHTDSLVDAINAIKATSWTPLAEAFYNAVGYYTQNTGLRLNSGDWPTTDPIEEWCQMNNILIITEGASTADKHNTVASFVAASGQNDEDTNDTGVDCGALNGSTYLDDLTHFAFRSENLHISQKDGEDKRPITTHIVVAGALRARGTEECSPDQLLDAAADNGGTSLVSVRDPSQLEDALRDSFSSIRSGAAAGSASSVISASRSGEGAAYQALFWPEKEDLSDNKVSWTGEVHSLFVDSMGLLYEDTDGDRTLDGDDLRVVFFFDDTTQSTKACYGELNADGSCNGTAKALEDVHYLWSAAEWLAGISPTPGDANQDIIANRTLVGSTASYVSASKKRFIFTWNDLDNDGITDSNEVLDFTPTTNWAGLGVSGGRGPVPLDFGIHYDAADTSATNAAVNEIVNWVRGLDQAGMRKRAISYDFDLDGTPAVETWRMADIVHSTPVSVGAPTEGFHFLYLDSSYIEFVEQYKHRRHMIYFGANDGMIHGVNGGFYDEEGSRFCRTGDCTDEGAVSASNPELGAEMWAYIPYNLLPHLKCLTEEGYAHRYFVDLRPRIFDARIFADDADHPNGWGTILVGGMRFGGAKVTPGTLDLDFSGTADYPADNRELTSAYFILDITNPEKPPELLGEFTRTTGGGFMDPGYTMAIPTIVSMKDGTNQADQDWYLIFGSGPTNVDGTSDQNGKLGVFPLKWLTDATRRPFRIPDTAPTSGTNQGGTFTLDANSFVSDIISVDFDLDSDYMTDAVYFGTVSGTWGADGGAFGGKLYRLVTRKLDTDGDQEVTEPSDWGGLLSPDPNPLPLFDAGRPITAAPSVGTDGKHIWVYFGTGRFLHSDDRTDSSSNALQTYYGVKEPMSFATVSGECTSTFTWETVEKTPTGASPTELGELGLLQVDQINVASAESADTAALSCVGGGTACLPLTGGTPLSNFQELLNYIVGTGEGCAADDDPGTDGWYRNFPLPRERNVGQGTLLSGLLTYTTYQPYDEVCRPEGLGYLYGLYYQTGTAFYKPVFISDAADGLKGDGSVNETVDLGRGLTTTPSLHVGKGDGAKAFVQTSTGAIVEVPQPQLPLNTAKSGRISWGIAH